MFEAATRRGVRGLRPGGGSEEGPEDVVGSHPATPVGRSLPAVDALRVS